MDAGSSRAALAAHSAIASVGNPEDGKARARHHTGRPMHSNASKTMRVWVGDGDGAKGVRLTRQICYLKMFRNFIWKCVLSCLNKFEKK